jgi:type VI secretion system secreted protein VgrG
VRGPEGAQEVGGGAGGDKKDGAGAAGPGPGHRDQIVKGTMTESIGASVTLATPGSVGWKTTGLSSFVVGGSHVTRAARAKVKTAGASSEKLGALHVKSGGAITRVVNGDVMTKIDGALKSTTDGAHNLKAGEALVLKIGGSLEMTGAHVSFVCGGAKVSASPGGVLVEADSITVQGDSTQSSKTTHL